MKKIIMLISICLITLAVTSCSTTTRTFPIVYTHNQNTDFIILGTVYFRSTYNVGYNTVFEEAKKAYPTTDYVIDIMIDEHEITTTYNIIAMAFKLLFSANMKQQETRYEYTIRGTAIQYIRKDIDGKIITEPTPNHISRNITNPVISTVIPNRKQEPINVQSFDVPNPSLIKYLNDGLYIVEYVDSIIKKESNGTYVDIIVGETLSEDTVLVIPPNSSLYILQGNRVNLLSLQTGSIKELADVGR